MILIDTNTWILFLLGDKTRVGEHLRSQRVRTCDVVIGELNLGSGLPESFRVEFLKMPRLPSPTAGETMQFIDRHRQSLSGAGVGWSDVQVILTAQKAGALLYTEDEAMRELWLDLGYRLADGGPRTQGT